MSKINGMEQKDKATKYNNIIYGPYQLHSRTHYMMYMIIKKHEHNI